MHHQLSPEEDGWSTTGDEFLAPAEIVLRLKEEFKYVTVDKAAGQRHIAGRVDYLQGLNAAGKNVYWSKESIEGAIKRLESAFDEAYQVTIADCEDPGNAYLSTTILPNEKLFFGYSSDDHMEESAAILARCAKALKYDIEEG